MRRKLIIFLLILGLFVLPIGGTTYGATLSELLELKQKELQMLDGQIEKYQVSIEEKQKQAKTLKRELAIIEERIEKIKLQIKETEIFIEELFDQGITSGYPDGTYRPENQVTRAEMAVFLVKTFNLPLP